MNQKKAKALRRLVRKNSDRIVLQSLEKTLDEPFALRLKTAMRIAAGRSGLLYAALRGSLILVVALLYFFLQSIL